jgi:hypothetical protein
MSSRVCTCVHPDPTLAANPLVPPIVVNAPINRSLAITVTFPLDGEVVLPLSVELVVSNGVDVGKDHSDMDMARPVLKETESVTEEFPPPVSTK